MVRAYAEIAGERFGRFVALERSHIHQGNAYWRCACDCGAERVVAMNNLRRGLSRSCGCLQSELTSARCKTHGEGDHSTREYRVWAAMKRRCLNPNAHAYERYGGRGITVCERWSASYLHFLEDMGRCPPNLTLERIDNNRGYEPSNCKWATYTEQAANQRKRRKAA